jgi:hypothetical protein
MIATLAYYTLVIAFWAVCIGLSFVICRMAHEESNQRRGR